MTHVAIPGGVWSEDAPTAAGPVRELALRPVGGEDELFLLDTVDQAAPSTRATALLARCLGDGGVAVDAGALAVGDREALLLQLRRLTLGETVDCVVSCPAEGCGERMELVLRVTDLLVPPYSDVRRAHDLTGELDGASYQVSFRLPTARDLDAVAPVARGDPERAANLLLDRCVREVTRNGRAVAADTLGPAVRAWIAAAMAEHDPQAEIELELACPVCHRASAVMFDTATFLLQELDARADLLMQEVHTLALHYHWAERDILQMPWRRRARYLELVAGSGERATAR